MGNKIITVNNFSKEFNDQQVVTGLNFDVNEGYIFVFFGANGSGKTITIRCLQYVFISL